MRSRYMTLHHIRFAAAAVTAGLLALSGCSSSSSKGSDNIIGAPSAAPTVTVSATPTPTRASGAPTISLPSDLTANIEFKPGEDATKDKAAGGLAYALRAFVEAEATGDINRPAMVYAYTGMASVYLNQAVQQLNSRNQTITGATRYYALTMEVKDPSNVVAAFCEDQSKGFAKEKASGKVLTTTLSIRDFTDWTMGLTLSDKGVWQVSSALAQKGSTRCQSAA